MSIKKAPALIIKIREVMKDIHFDARIKNVPRVVLMRIISCMEKVENSRVQGMI
jgi:hypothetical protein